MLTRGVIIAVIFVINFAIDIYIEMLTDVFQRQTCNISHKYQLEENPQENGVSDLNLLQELPSYLRSLFALCRLNVST